MEVKLVEGVVGSGCVIVCVGVGVCGGKSFVGDGEGDDIYCGVLVFDF